MARLAFVIPWFGRELRGGAERLTWELSTRLAARGHDVEVWTTCCSSHGTPWDANDVPAGTTAESGLTARRFPVADRSRDERLFAVANAELLIANADRKRPGCSPVSAAAAHHFVRHNIHSRALTQGLARAASSFDAVVLVPYLYGTTFDGSLAAGSRAALLPLLHDEAYAYLPAVAELFLRVPRVLFVSSGERELAARLYGPAMWTKGELVGCGIEAPAAGEMVPGLEPRRYLLALGRRDPTKNTPLLLEAYRRLGAERVDAPPLVLAGPGAVGELPAGAVDLGTVSEARRNWLLAHCTALLQPSQHESLSLVVYEAWLAGRPVVVHGSCEATRGPVLQAAGGWCANGVDEWVAKLRGLMEASSDELDAAGLRGRRYAEATCRWEAALDRYEAALLTPGGTTSQRRRRRPTAAIHQVVAALAFGDAISNYALDLRHRLRELGYQSEIFARHIDPAMATCAIPFDATRLADAAVLYHHSIGCEITVEVARLQGPKALLYHNITPAEYFAAWDPELARLVDEGRRALPALARVFDASFADSAFNAAELAATGFRDPAVIPIAVDPARWDQPADAGWLEALSDRRPNVLCVGRLAPNKCQHDVVAALAHLRERVPAARLVLVGAAASPAYARFVTAEVGRRGLDTRVLVLGNVGESVLNACYRTADLLVSASEHEGFCLPLVEAMWFEVPILAYAAGAVPETLGDAGELLFTKEPEQVAARMEHLLQDEAARRDMALRQRRQRTCFLPAGSASAIEDLAARLTRTGAAP